MTNAQPLSNRQFPVVQTPTDRLVYSTVRIECEYHDGGKGTGTGFFFAFAKQSQGFVPAIVTNKHVIYGASKGAFHIHLRGADGMPSVQQSERLEISNFQSRWLPHPDDSVDLCVMPFGDILQQADANGRGLGFIPLDMSLIPSENELAEYTPLEEVLMIGYPNGIWDSHNNMPILRRGITATHPAIDYEGKQEFLIDAACFPGSSGSPVLLCSTNGYYMRNGSYAIGGMRIKLLGVLYAGPQYSVTGELQIVNVPTRQDVQAVSRIPNNLGLVIKSGRLRFFEEYFQQAIIPRT